MEKEYIRQAAAAARELMETAEMKSGQILVVGCSSSEVESYRLGTHSSEETGKELFEAIYGENTEKGRIPCGAVLRASEPRPGSGT